VSCFVVGSDGVICYPARGLWLLSVDRFSLFRSSFKHFWSPGGDSYWFNPPIFPRWSRSGLVPDHFCNRPVWTDAHKWNGPTWTDLVWSRTIWKLFCVNIASDVVCTFGRGLGLKRRNKESFPLWWQKSLPRKNVRYWPFNKKESVRGNKPDRQVPMGSVWRPSISHRVILASSGKRFPCLWKTNHYSTAKQDIFSRFQLEHLIVYDQYDICIDGKEWHPETWTFSVSLRALWIVTPSKLRRKYPTSAY